MKLSYIIFLAALVISCDQDDTSHDSAELIGTWNGVKKVYSNDNHDEASVISTPTFQIAFAYDHGIIIHANGKLEGRVAQYSEDDSTYIWSKVPEYVDKWERLTHNKIRLGELEYELVSLTNREMVIFREINSHSSETKTLERE